MSEELARAEEELADAVRGHDGDGAAALLDEDSPYVVSDVWLRRTEGWRLRWRSWTRLNAEFLREELGA